MTEWRAVRRDEAIDPYVIRSSCGRYSICRYHTKDGERFELWDRKERIGDWGSAKAAKDGASAGSNQTGRAGGD